MKKLVVFYSRTGNSKNAAVLIARKLNADIDEIISLKDYSGAFGYIRAGHDAIRNKTVNIKYLKDPKDFGLIVLVTPNWGKRMASPVLSYIKLNDLSKKTIGICCTQGGSFGESVISQIEKIVNKKSKADIIISQFEIKDKSYINKIKEFCNKLK